MKKADWLPDDPTAWDPVPQAPTIRTYIYGCRELAKIAAHACFDRGTHLTQDMVARAAGLNDADRHRLRYELQLAGVDVHAWDLALTERPADPVQAIRAAVVAIRHAVDVGADLRTLRAACGAATC